MPYMTSGEINKINIHYPFILQINFFLDRKKVSEFYYANRGLNHRQFGILFHLWLLKFGFT